MFRSTQKKPYRPCTSQVRWRAFSKWMKPHNKLLCSYVANWRQSSSRQTSRKCSRSMTISLWSNWISVDRGASAELSKLPSLWEAWRTTVPTSRLRSYATSFRSWRRRLGPRAGPSYLWCSLRAMSTLATVSKNRSLAQLRTPTSEAKEGNQGQISMTWHKIKKSHSTISIKNDFNYNFFNFFL